MEKGQKEINQESVIDRDAIGYRVQINRIIGANNNAIKRNEIEESVMRKDVY